MFIAGIISLIGTVLATGIGVAQSVVSANYQKQLAQQQARQAEINAEFQANQLKRQAMLEAQDEANKQGEQLKDNRRRLALMESQYAVSGVQIQGTPASFLEGQAESDELSLGLSKLNSKEKIRGYLLDAENTKILGSATASSYRSSGNASYLSGMVNAGSTLLGGSASSADKYIGLSSKGIF